jgi:acetyl-CoA synthetase
MGKPFPGHDVVIVDANGESVPDGEVGHIALRLPDPVCFLEYQKDPDATESAFLAPNLFDTGDLGVRDEDGYLFHRGRADSLILTSGYRVSPFEVESVLLRHPEVDATIVAGVRDPSRGERIVAAVVPTGAGSDDLRDALTSLVRETLGPHKAPREIRFVDSIPQTRTGKADREAIASQFDWFAEQD